MMNPENTHQSPNFDPERTEAIEELPPQEVGQLIRSLRKQRGVSGDELAKQLGVSRAAVGHWERSRRSPPRTLRFARSITTFLNPTDDERKILLGHVADPEATLESLLVEYDQPQLIHPDEIMYEDMMNRAERIQRLGASVVKLTQAIDEEVEFMRSILKTRFLGPNQIGILDPQGQIKDSQPNPTSNDNDDEVLGNEN